MRSSWRLYSHEYRPWFSNKIFHITSIQIHNTCATPFPFPAFAEGLHVPPAIPWGRQRLHTGNPQDSTKHWTEPIKIKTRCPSILKTTGGEQAQTATPFCQCLRQTSGNTKMIKDMVRHAVLRPWWGTLGFPLGGIFNNSPLEIWSSSPCIPIYKSGSATGTIDFELQATRGLVVNHTGAKLKPSHSVEWFWSVHWPSSCQLGSVRLS